MGSIIIDWFASKYDLHSGRNYAPRVRRQAASDREGMMKAWSMRMIAKIRARQRPAAEREKKEMTNKNRKERFPAHLVLACIAGLDLLA